MMKSIVAEMKKGGFDMSEFEKGYELVTLHQALKSYPPKHFEYGSCLYGYHSKQMKAIIQGINPITGKVSLYFTGDSNVDSKTKSVSPSSVFVRIYND